jgi:hypothetical protein
VIVDTACVEVTTSVSVLLELETVKLKLVELKTVLEDPKLEVDVYQSQLLSHPKQHSTH